MKNPFFMAANLPRNARVLGWRAALQLCFHDASVRAGIGKPQVFEMVLKDLEFPLVMRTGTSDREVLGQVFIDREYDLAELLSPKSIVDLGANVGYASAFFLSKYPTAKVLAVEPDPGNYEICCRNLAQFGDRARVIHGAVWGENATLELKRGAFRDGREWTTQVEKARTQSVNTPAVNGYSVPALIEMTGEPEIDLLKIDVERSELEIFSRETETWLPRVKNIYIELHGPDCEVAFFQAVSGYSYDLSNSGDLTVCRNLRPGTKVSAAI
jgi:FkbM family methyltransferase